MPNQKNLNQVDQIKSKLPDIKSIVVADYSGLDVASQNDLRQKISEAGGEFSVIKNRLFKIAVSDSLTSGQDELQAALNGQNGFLFSLQDAVSALKVLFEFAKDHENLEIKIGILDGKVLSFDETEALSKLPSKPELIVQLISRVQSPAYGLVNVLSGNTRNLLYALNAIKEKKAN